MEEIKMMNNLRAGTIIDRLEIEELKTLIIECNDKKLVKKYLDLVIRLEKVPENEKDEHGKHANYYLIVEPIIKVVT